MTDTNDHDDLPPEEDETRVDSGSIGMNDATRASAGAPAAAGRSIPASIGPYRILGKLGEGGMGVVFEAEQTTPRRKVALKVVRGGEFIDESRVKMFQREADTLARLKHPNIGAIYESGRTDDGQHFFAMELVRGETLDVYLSRRGWTASLSPMQELRFRLELFRTIADAVHYAHQRGVIHRDLKPSNVVVDADHDDTIKILDFGLARITDGDVAAATMATEIGTIKGTLPYMSPEQARGNPEEIDLRTDVYSLGVMLYEMLSGQRPYDVGKKSLPEAVRIICEESPRSLSQTVSGVRRLDPDIETIIGKSLEKDSDRRYDSAAALSEDVGRYLSSEPILARPPSTTYQLRKFASRNRALVAGVAATFLVLLAGIVVSTTFGLKEAAQRREAEQARADVETVVEFQSGMISGVDAEEMGRRLAGNLREAIESATRERGLSDAETAAFLESYDASMSRVNATNTALELIDRDILERAVATIEEQFGDRPLIDARLRASIGKTYRMLARYERAEPQIEMALDIRRRVLGHDHPDTLSSMNLLGSLYTEQNRLDDAEPILLRVLESRRRLLGDDHPDTLGSMTDLCNLYYEQRRSDLDEQLHIDVLEGYRRLYGDDDRRTLAAMANLALLYQRERRREEAEALHLQTIEGWKRVVGGDDPSTLRSINNLANLYQGQGRFDEAEKLHLEALESRRRVLGDDHPNTLQSVMNLGNLFNDRGQYEKAEPLYLEALDGYKRVLGDDHLHTFMAMHNLAWFQLTREPAESRDPQSALKLALEVVEKTDYKRSNYLDTLALAYELTGDISMAIETRQTAMALMNDGSQGKLTQMMKMGWLHERQGRYDEAERWYRDALEGQRAALGDDHADTVQAMNQLAWLQLTREPAASRAPREALELALEVAEKSGRREPAYLDTLSLAYHLMGNTAKAIENQREAIALLPKGESGLRTEMEQALARFVAAQSAP